MNQLGLEPGLEFYSLDDLFKLELILALAYQGFTNPDNRKSVEDWHVKVKEAIKNKQYEDSRKWANETIEDISKQFPK